MENKKISELAKQIRGVSYKPSDLHTKLDSQSVILLRANNISDGLINFDDVVYVDKCKVSQNQYLRDGDILICASSGSKHLVGKAAAFHSQIDCTFGAFCKVVRPHSDLIDYLEVYFQSHIYRKKISEVAMGANINNIRNEHIDALELPVGCPEENATFTKTVHAIMKIIRVRQQQLKKLDELVKSRFIELFGDPDGNPMNWETAELERHLEIVGGFAFKSEGFTESGIPVLRIGNINSGHFLPVNMVFWPDDPSLARYKMYPGDLVMSLTGTVGKDDYGNVCVLSDEYPEYYLNQRNAKLAIGATLNRHYLSEMLKFSRIKKRLTGISRGVRQANISNRDILALRVPIPPIKLQEQFAAFVEQTDKSKFVIQQALDKAQLLFDSLMQKYFY